jgi:hypothetical protein
MLAKRFLGTSNLSFGRFGMGYRPPTPLHLARRVGVWGALPSLLIAKGVSAPATDNTTGTMPLVGKIIDQGPLGQCTWCSTPKAAKISIEGAGVTVASLVGTEDFSQRIGYADVREVERGAQDAAGVPLEPLTDSGAMPDDCITVVQQLGLAPMGPLQDGRYNDNSTALVNQEVTLSEVERTVLAVGAYDVNLTATDRTDQWKAAINARIGMTMAFFVDTAFMNWDPSRGPVQKIDLNDPNGGGHQVCGPVAWETSSSLGVVWTYLNSWSAAFGENGFFKITDRCLMMTIDSSIAYDIKIQPEAA